MKLFSALLFLILFFIVYFSKSFFSFMQFLFSLIPNKSFPIIFEDSERFISKVFIGYSGSILFVVLFGPIVFGINLFSFIINGEKNQV